MVNDREKARLQKVNRLIQKNISKTLHAEIKDPRLQFVDILEVAVTNDFSLARVYYTIFNSGSSSDVELASKLKELESAFTKASGFIRSKIAKDLQFKKTPEIRFIYDLRYQNKEKVDDILKNLSVKSEENTNNND
tara:strand:- start:1565 stop:1972 length:408 start_codon:yes stop_codon:yes gene_type:complete